MDYIAKKLHKASYDSKQFLLDYNIKMLKSSVLEKKIIALN